jgi:SsrA-binding protein
MKYYKLIADNRKAYFDYQIEETFKAGIVLSGSEVKSVRLGRVNFKDSFGRVEAGEVLLYNMHISPYEKGMRDKGKGEDDRPRKLLLNGSELKRIIGKVSQKGMTLVPTKIYFDGDWAKVDIALAKAKRKYEKRDSIRQREDNREIEKVLRGKK